MYAKNNQNCITESVIIKNKKIQIFNCSDGVKIDGTIPIHSKNINLIQINKDKLIDKLCSNFSKLKEIPGIPKIQFDNFVNTIDKIIYLIDTNIVDSFNSFFHLIFKINRVSDNFKLDHQIAYSLLRGTTVTYIAQIYSHVLADGENNQSIKYCNLGLKKLKEFLIHVKSDTTTILQDL